MGHIIARFDGRPVVLLDVFGQFGFGRNLKTVLDTRYILAHPCTGYSFVARASPDRTTRRAWNIINECAWPDSGKGLE